MGTKMMEIPEAEIKWLGEKRWKIIAGKQEIEISLPPSFGGEAGLATPEDLFTGSVLACFTTTLFYIMQLSKVEAVSFNGKSAGKISITPSGRMEFDEVRIQLNAKVRSNGMKRRLEKVIEKAKEVCPVANSIKAKVKVDAEIEVDKS